MLRLVDFLKQHVTQCPDKEAVVQGECRLSYAELNTFTDQLVHALRQDGVLPGDRVGIILDNSPGFILAYLAVLKMGGVAVPLGPSMTLHTLLYIIQDCSSKVLFLEKRISPWVADLTSFFRDKGAWRRGDAATIPTFLRLQVSTPLDRHFPVMGDDVAVIVYTSGTTGQPKGVMLTHSNLAAIAGTGKDLLKLSFQDRIGIIVPLFHLYGLREIDGCLRVGGTLVLVKNLTYPAQVLKQLHRERITGFSAVPSSLALFMDRYESLLQACHEHLRYITLGTAPAPASLLSQLKAVLPTTQIWVTYGLTEASRVCAREVTEPDLKPGSVGPPYPGVSLSILNEEGQPLETGAHGRVAVKSPMVMKGYWNRPDLTHHVLRSDGTLLTPDYGWLDSEGYLFLMGRGDELINSGGEKINPGEIETVLQGHSAVAEVAVVGSSDPNGVLGEVAKAYVVLNSGFQPDPEELIKHCARHLESFKVPKIIEFCNSLPRTVLGKTQRSLLK